MLPVIISLSGYILSTIHGLFILDRDARQLIKTDVEAYKPTIYIRYVTRGTCKNTILESL